MNKKIKLAKIIIALVSIIGILPAIAMSIDVYFSSLVHLVYSDWFHICLNPILKVSLPALVIAFSKGLLFSFNLQLKVKEDPDIHDIVFPLIFFSGGIFCLLAAADMYFSRAAFYSHSILFQIEVNKYGIAPFCFIAIFPCFMALFIYMVISQLIAITKKPEEEIEEELD